MNIDNLDEPLELQCGAVLPNRFALAPLTNTQSNLDGTLHNNEFNWLMRRAGHFGLISTCATFVSEQGHAWKGQLGIANNKQLPGLTKLAYAIKEAHSLPIVQLHHGGSRAECAPRKISSSDAENVHAATNDEVQQVIEDFTDAALRAELAGFAGVEVHGANGYIFTQFLAANINRRTDEYGGTIENRAKFLLETVRSIKKAVSPSFMVNVRISPVDNINRLGLYLEDSKKVAKMLANEHIDVLHLSLRDAIGSGPFEEDKTPVVSAIRSVVPDTVKIATTGGIWTRADADKAQNAGADIIVLGKASIIHPDWVTNSKIQGFKPYLPPWDVESLKKVSVSQDFINYLDTAHHLVKY